MSNDIVKQFANFKIRHSLSNDFIKKIITEYANSELDFACLHFSEKYNISRSSFYQARDYAIICCLIDGDTCNKVQKKTVENYKRNNPKSNANNSVLRFSRLSKRKQQFLDTFSDDDIRDIAHKYEEGISIENIALVYDTGEYGIKLLLRKGIVSLIVSGKTTESIKLRLGNKLDKILAAREHNKKLLLSCIEKEIELLNLQLEYYDLYFRNVTEKPSKETLQTRLTNAIQRKKEVLRY